MANETTFTEAVIEKATLTDIGDAIREQEGSTEPVPTSQMAARIRNLSGKVVLDESFPATEPIEENGHGATLKAIWAWVKGLFGNLAAVATSGSYNDLTDKPKIPEGADVLTLNGQRVFKNGTEEITTYTALLALVKTGGVVLLDTVAGTIAKEALFHPHMADETAIRFDATGMLGEKVYTRSFAFTPKTDGGIVVSRGDLTEVAKKLDLAGKLDKTGGTMSGGLGLPEIDVGSVYASQIFIDYISSLKLASSGVSVLSGITEQDITDFLNYKGEMTFKAGISYKKDDVVSAMSGFWRCKADFVTHGEAGDTDYFDKIYNKDSGKTGLEKLIALYEKYKATLFTDTAFKTKVEEIIDEHGGGGGDMTFVLKYNPEDEGYIYFDDGQPETTNA